MHLWRVAEVAASLQAAVERSYGPRYADEDDDDAGLDRKGWSGADALESTGGVNGEEGQRKVAMMGRRLTSLRVREMELARQATIQAAELKDLRMERGSLQSELREAQVEAAAELGTEGDLQEVPADAAP